MPPEGHPDLPGETMLAAVYRGIDDVRVEELSVPEIGPGEVMVRVRVCGVCGTDLKKIRHGLVPPPRVFGHEMAGEIVKVGEGVEGWAFGDRVAVMHHVPCLACHFCLERSYAQCPTYKHTGTTAGFEPAGGGFAQYIRVMDWIVRRGVVRIPSDVSLEQAAFIEPLNTCLKAVRKTGIHEGLTVLILGQGPIGLLFTQLARMAGAYVIATDPISSRRELAQGFGAAALPADDDDVREAVREVTDGRGADITILTVADASRIPFALELTRPGGKALLFAQTWPGDQTSIDAASICAQEKDLIGSYSSDITLLEETAELIFSRRVDVLDLISHRFPLEQIQEALALAGNPSQTSLKVMVEP